MKWSEVTQSCPTLCDPWTVTYQAPLSMGFLRQEYWSGLLFPSPGDLPNPGIEPGSSTLQADALPSETWGKYVCVCIYICMCVCMYVCMYVYISQSVLVCVYFMNACQFSSVSQSCPTLCDPMDCSMPGFPVHHQLLKLAQTHVHWENDAIQPSHPLLSPFPPVFNFSQHHSLFKWVSSLHHIRWPKYWSFSFSISPSN